MNDQVKPQQGIDLDKIKIDQNGEIELDDELLDDVAGGLVQGGGGCNYNCETPIGG